MATGLNLASQRCEGSRREFDRPTDDQGILVQGDRHRRGCPPRHGRQIEGVEFRNTGIFLIFG